MKTAVELPDQKSRDVIEKALDNTLLVEAAAGTGKTTSMMKRMVGLLAEGKCKTHELAAVTFTRKSAAELRSRFQLALEKSLREAHGLKRDNLHVALSNLEKCFIGTIHSFCGRLLRERPVEAEVDVAFEEIDENADLRLRKKAWDEYVTRLFVDNDPLLSSFNDLGIEIGQLWDSFSRFANYPDVGDWPAPPVDPPEFDQVRALLNEVVGHFGKIRDRFPSDYAEWGDLMRKYARVARSVRTADSQNPIDLVAILKLFTTADKEPEKWIDGKEEAKEENAVWAVFKQRADAYVSEWRKHCYPTCMTAMKGALLIYDRMRREAGQLNYQDLLIKARDLLKDKPLIREYFRRRFTHILVDEFQDTDPIQAEVMLFLTASVRTEQDWQRCKPDPGSLFVVGDPKQSIYRFRRADIVTYNTVKKIIRENGQVVRLTGNFRSTEPLIGWVNRTFTTRFPPTETEHAPVYVPLVPVDSHDGSGPFEAVQRLQIPVDKSKDKSNDEICEYEAGLIAAAIRKALDEETVLPKKERQVRPGDFMIITRKRKNLATYSRILQQWGIAHQVAGGNAVNTCKELSLLHTCLAAVVRPDNPLSLVAALRSELFGISDSALYDFKRSGGVFAYSSTIPQGFVGDEADAFADAFRRLAQYARWFEVMPPLAAMERMVGDLGLAVLGAAEPDGNARAGSLLKGLELLRAAQHDVWTVADLVDFLAQLMNDEEKHDGLPAIPHDAAAAQVLNLHKAKGLEAPVVFLADPTGNTWSSPTIRIDRSGKGTKGYMVMSGTSSVSYYKPVLALPQEWEALKEEEKKFETAEETRLLYVAATRAGIQLMVTQRERSKEGGNKYNPWNFFRDNLAEHPELHDHRASRAAAAPPPTIDPAACRVAEAHIARRWESTLAPTYRTTGVKVVAVPQIAMPAADVADGTRWGSLIHSLLQVAMANPEADLRGLARDAADEQELGDDLIEAALETIRSVTASEIWKRAMKSSRRMVEVPFQRMWAAPDDQGDGKTLLRGVIDLVFSEPQGWVIVDYKTDRRPGHQLHDLVERYREQVRLYAEAWTDITGQEVSEAGLYFTHPGTYVIC